jgi:hypothetical protein
MKRNAATPTLPAAVRAWFSGSRGIVLRATEKDKVRWREEPNTHSGVRTRPYLVGSCLPSAAPPMTRARSSVERWRCEGHGPLGQRRNGSHGEVPNPPRRRRLLQSRSRVSD